MKRYTLKVWDGFSNRSRPILAANYEDARHQAGVDGFPPGYIWSIDLQPSTELQQ